MADDFGDDFDFRDDCDELDDSDWDSDDDFDYSDDKLFQTESLDDDEIQDDDIQEDQIQDSQIQHDQIQDVDKSHQVECFGTVVDRRTGGVTVRNGRPIALQSSNDCWKIEPSAASGYVKVSHITSSLIRGVAVPSNRLAKFKQKLDVDGLLHMLGASSSCVAGCRRGCRNLFSLAEIVQCRLGSFLTAKTEQEVTEHLVRQLRDSDPKNLQPTADSECESKSKPIKYAIGGKPTCHVFWSRAHGASEDKMKKVRDMVRHGSTIAQHGNKSKSYKGTQTGICYAFWHHFFEKIVKGRTTTSDCSPSITASSSSMTPTF